MNEKARNLLGTRTWLCDWSTDVHSAFLHVLLGKDSGTAGWNPSALSPLGTQKLENAAGEMFLFTEDVT